MRLRSVALVLLAPAGLLNLAYLAERVLLPDRTALLSGLWLAALALLLAWAARSLRLSPSAMGLMPRRLLWWASVGLAVGLVITAPALLVLAYPPLVEGPVSYQGVEGFRIAGLALRGLWMLLFPVLVEELAFRGVLMGWLLERTGRWQAVVLASLAFTLGHLVVNHTTVAATNMAESGALFWLALAVAHAAVFLGGVLFAVLRLLSGSIVPAIAAHWASNMLLLAFMMTRTSA